MSEVEDLQESVKKMEARLKRELDEVTRQSIENRLTTARTRLSEIARLDEELHQRAMADNRRDRALGKW